MNQVEVIAICGFEHNGRRMPGDRFQVSELHAKALKDRCLVSLPDDGEQKDKAPQKSAARAVTGQSKSRAAGGKSNAATEKPSPAAGAAQTDVQQAPPVTDPALADGQQLSVDPAKADENATADNTSKE